METVRNGEAGDIIELSKQGYFTILLDENLRGLEAALEDDGFKVIVPAPGLTDETLNGRPGDGRYSPGTRKISWMTPFATTTT